MENLPKILGGRLTQLSLLALGLALALGIVGSATGSDWIDRFAAAIAPIGDLWISALRMTVIPLVLTQLLTAITGTRDRASIGGMGVGTLALFLVFLGTVGTLTMVAMAPVMTLVPLDAGSIADLLAKVTVPAEATQAAAHPAASLGDWVHGLIPENVFAAATSGAILPLLVATILFGFATNQLEAAHRSLLAELFSAVASAMMHMVFWVLWLTPVAVFALVLGVSLSSGATALGALLFYVLAVTTWMLVVTGALYPVSALAGRVAVGDFARAMAPANMVAVSTRSSIACLPALIKGGREHLGFSESATGFVLPLSTSLFKLSTVTAEPVRFLFLSHLFGLDFSVSQTATFLITLILLSFAGVGLPRGGSGFDTLPAYAAAGIPIEGLVLVVTVDTIPDIAKTLINVTGHMTAATIMSRGERLRKA